MSWGSPSRPKIGYGKVNSPSPREGVDGDIQVRQSNLGAKLFGKISGKWYHTPLTATDGNPVTRFGTGLSNYLSIDNDSIDIFKNNVKVASFGETLVIGKVANDCSRLEIDSSGNIRIINRQGTTSAGDSTKIELLADGTANFTGAITTGSSYAGDTIPVNKGGTGATDLNALQNSRITTNANGTLSYNGSTAADPSLGSIGGSIGKTQCDTTIISGGKIVTGLLTATNIETGTLATNAINFGGANSTIAFNNNANAVNSSDSVIVGFGSFPSPGSGGDGNVAVGRSVLANNTSGAYNVCIGYEAGNDINEGDGTEGYGDDNICIGRQAGDNITTGRGNVIIGGTDPASATDNEQLVIASGKRSSDAGVTWITGDDTGSISNGNMTTVSWTTSSLAAGATEDRLLDQGYYLLIVNASVGSGAVYNFNVGSSFVDGLNAIAANTANVTVQDPNDSRKIRIANTHSSTTQTFNCFAFKIT